MPSIDVGSRFNGVLSEINFFSRKIHGFSVIIENLQELGGKKCKMQNILAFREITFRYDFANVTI